MVDDVERGAGFDMIEHEGEVVIELVGDHWDVTIAKNEMRNAADNHDTHKETDWEDGGDAGVGVVGKKVVPFIENVTEAMSNKNSEREEDEDGGIGVQARKEDSEND